MILAPPLSTDNRILSPLSTSLNCQTKHSSAPFPALPPTPYSLPYSQKQRNRSSEVTHSQLPRPMQTLDLIDPVPNLIQQLVEALLFAHLPRGVEDEHGVRADVVTLGSVSDNSLIFSATGAVSNGAGTVMLSGAKVSRRMKVRSRPACLVSSTLRRRRSE